MFYGQSLLYTYSLPYLRILLPTIPPICEAMRRGGKIYSVDEEEGKLQCGFILQIALFSSMANKNAFYDPRRKSARWWYVNIFWATQHRRTLDNIMKVTGAFRTHTQGTFLCSKINCRVFSFTFTLTKVTRHLQKGYMHTAEFMTRAKPSSFVQKIALH